MLLFPTLKLFLSLANIVISMINSLYAFLYYNEMTKLQLNSVKYIFEEKITLQINTKLLVSGDQVEPGVL